MDPLPECISHYLECKKLLEEKDPETEPYRSKYKAIDILLKSKKKIDEYLKKIGSTHSEFILFKAAFSAIVCQIGSLYIETNEFSKAEEFLMECFASIEDHLHSDFVLSSIQARNCLGYIWSHRCEHIESKKWLEGAEKLYKDFKKSKNRVVLVLTNILETGINDEGEKELEAAHTLTNFYLAQVYSALKDVLNSAVYCHETLRRNLLYKGYDPIEWALNSATLSQVFTERILFKQARHHLAAASYILDTYEETIKDMEGSQEEIEAKKEELRHRSADVSRCWACYGIFLLEYSSGEKKAPEEKNEKLENLWFDNLDLSLYENQITDSVVVAFEDAREVFLISQKHLNKAKEYYTLEDRASDHVQIVQSHSNLFRHLTAFEPDEERQYKMMKKRVDLLTPVLKELNPKYYLDVCRQLWYELGETYHYMMQIKFQKVKDSKVPSPQALMKINSLTDSSISHFNEFLDSLKDKKTKELPDPIPEELIAPVLIAHFYLGRLYYKYITQDRRKQIENTTKAYECFKYLVDYCEKSEKAKSVVGEEYNMSKEMMTLLQMKVLQL